MINFTIIDENTFQTLDKLFQVSITHHADEIFYGLYERDSIDELFSKYGYFNSLVDVKNYLESL